jgi:hypothetical protein
LEHLCHEAVLQEILKLRKEEDLNVKYHYFKTERIIIPEAVLMAAIEKIV